MHPRNLTIVSLSASVITSVFETVLNAYLVVTYWRRRNLHNSIPNLLIVNQCFVDLFNAVVFCASEIARIYFEGYIGDFPAGLRICLSIIWFLSITSSLLYFLLIGIDRLYKTIRPLRYRTRVTTTRVKYIIAAIWIISFVLSPLFVLIFLRIINLPIEAPGIVGFMYVLLILLNMFLFPAAYIKIKRSFRYRASFNAGVISSDQSLQQQLESLRQIRLMKLFSMMFAVFFVAFILFIPGGFFNLNSPDSAFLPLLNTISGFLFKLSSIFNPTVVLIMRKEFRPQLR